MSLICKKPSRRRAVGQPFFVLPAQDDLQVLAGGGQPGGDSLFGHAERSRDLAVGVAVVMAKHQRRRLFGRELADRAEKLGALGDEGWIRAGRRAAEPPDHLARLADALVA